MFSCRHFSKVVRQVQGILYGPTKAQKSNIPEDSKSNSGGIFCIFGNRTFVPRSWMCKKQPIVSHISTESEVISSDAGLRIDGTPALDLWDLVVDVLLSSKKTSQYSESCATTKPKKETHQDQEEETHQPR